MAEPVCRSEAPDPTFYPDEEKVPETQLHRNVGVVLEQLVRRWLAEQGVRALVGANQFIYWVQHAPTRTVAPDVYVLPGVDPDTKIDSWKVWDTGIVPSVVVEVVGRDPWKDYEVGPARYDELGVQELIVYDPGHAESQDRVRFQVWRRRGDDLADVARTDARQVRSAVLGCLVREVGEGGDRLLRLATGPRGDTLVPTGEEAEHRAREAAERERDAERSAREAAERDRDAAERERDAERGAREAAERALARLRAELERKPSR